MTRYRITYTTDVYADHTNDALDIGYKDLVLGHGELSCVELYNAEEIKNKMHQDLERAKKAISFSLAAR